MTIYFEKNRDRRNCTIRLISNNDDIDEITIKFKFMTKFLKQKMCKIDDHV